MESSWRGAWKDTECFRQSAKSFWGLEVLGAAVFVLIGGYIGFLSTPENATRVQGFMYPAVGAAVGVVVGLFVAFVAIYVWNVFRAPYRQRDKARVALQEARVQLEDKNKQINEKRKLDFSLVWYQHKWWLRTAHGKQDYWDDERDGRGLLLTSEIAINICDRIQVESVELDIGERIYKSDWQSQGFYISEEREVTFDIPLDTPRGKRTARLRAVVNGIQWQGETFTIELPQGQQVFRMGDSQT